MTKKRNKTKPNTTKHELKKGKRKRKEYHKSIYQFHQRPLTIHKGCWLILVEFHSARVY